MLSEPPRCRPFPVLALKGADSPRGLHRGHSPGHMSPPGARSTGGSWLLPASWPDPKSLRQVNPDHDERYRGANSRLAHLHVGGRLLNPLLGIASSIGQKLGHPGLAIEEPLRLALDQIDVGVQQLLR